CARAYALLFHGSAFVNLSFEILGGISQFIIRARTSIPRGTELDELFGVMSRDSPPSYDNTKLSQMKCKDGQIRILFGPLRFVNHSCKANTEFYHLNGNIKAQVLVTSRDIKKGEEITVNYGQAYFTNKSAECFCFGCEAKREQRRYEHLSTFLNS
ncbi:hypothetical protein R3P38DRAFT_2512545, partial [Favolaschia claudopus]